MHTFSQALCVHYILDRSKPQIVAPVSNDSPEIARQIKQLQEEKASMQERMQQLQEQVSNLALIFSFWPLPTQKYLLPTPFCQEIHRQAANIPAGQS